MLRPPRLHVMEVNPYLTCVLCGGYFVDATTIIECLHSFCKTCIVRYLESSKFCPICDVQVHKTRPLMNIRADKTLQDIVYKLVPGLFRNEMKRRRDFFEANPEAAAYVTCQEDRGELTEQRVIYSPDDTISLSLEYGYGKNQLPTNGHSATTTDSGDDTDSKRRFLCCPAAVTVAHLKKFITMKYGLTQSYMVDLMYYDDSLRDDYKLMDIAYIYTWKRNGPMRLFYRILDKPRKRLKTCHPSLTETPTVSADDKDNNSVIPQIPDKMPSGIETNGVGSSSTEEGEDTFVEIQSGSQKKKTNKESSQDNLKSLCGESFKESRPVPLNSTSDNSQLHGKQQVITIEKKKKDYKPQASNVFYCPKAKTKQDNSFKDKSTTTETHRDLWNSLLKETPRIVDKLKLKPVELPQKPEEQTQLTEAKKYTSQIEYKKRTNITETMKTTSSYENKNLNGSSEPKTLTNPTESTKPNNPVGPKKYDIPVESKIPNSFTVTSLADKKKQSIPIDTMKPISRDESKKSTISDEHKKPSSLNESKKLSNPDESKKPSSSGECKKLSSPNVFTELSGSDEPKEIFSPHGSNKLTNLVESKELTNADESKKLTNSNEYNKFSSPDEYKKPTSSAEYKKPASSAEPKAFTNLVESKKLTSPAESKKLSTPTENTINLAETKKLGSLQEIRKHSNLTETKKLITPTEKNNPTNPTEIKQLSIEPHTVKTTEVNSTHLAPTVSSSFSSLVSATEALKNQDHTSEVLPAVLGEKGGRHLTTSLQKVPKFSFSEDSKVSWHQEIIEKKSRKDSELKISNSPEFVITKPREIPPIKISRKLSIKIVDHDRLESKEDSEVDSGVGSDVSSRPETQLSVEDDLWSPTNSTPEIEKPATPSKPSLTPPPTPSPSTSNPCPSPNAGYPLCPTPLHVPSISPKLCLSPREENEPQRDDIGALDLSLSHRHEIRHRDRSSQPRSRHVANPPVLDKHRQQMCLPAPTTPQLKRPPPPPVPHTHVYNRKGESGRNHRFKGSTLTVINPDPNSYHPKLVIKNLDPRPDHSHHHHNHRM